VGSSRLKPTTDVSPADWVVEEIGEFGAGVRGLLPSRFEAYTRILHPGAEVGELAPDLLAALCEVLEPHTSTAARCWFCLWEGWGWVGGRPSAALIGGPGSEFKLGPAFPPEVMDGPRVRLPGRDYILFEGPLNAATEMGQRYAEQIAAAHPDVDLEARGIDVDAFTPQSPSLFWPDDRSWCVATEIDLDSTYVGGSQALVDAILADSQFEPLPADLDDSGRDEINPPPPDQ
jgi:hypothetical protein